MNCLSCDLELSEEARFCTQCGAATAVGNQETRARLRARARGENRAAWVLGLVFAGGLFAVFAPVMFFDPMDGLSWGGVLMQSGIDFAVFLLAIALLRSERRAHVISEGPVARSAWAWALPIGLLGFAVSHFYVEGLAALLSFEVESELDPAEFWPMLYLTIIAAPLLEELLCRGAAWQAALELGNERIALVLTAVLFAVLHGANGGFVLEFPHRFAGGLLLGWLRWRTGSIVPCVLAHFIWNVLATAVSS